MRGANRIPIAHAVIVQSRRTEKLATSVWSSPPVIACGHIDSGGGGPDQRHDSRTSCLAPRSHRSPAIRV